MCLKMATKKKLPNSRRCRSAEKVAEFCYCSLNNANVSSGRCGTDVPDRVNKSRHSSQASDGAEKYLYSESLTFEQVDQDRRPRELPPHKNHNEQKSFHQGPAFNCLDVLIGLSSIAFFYFDVVTDILLARDYFYQHNYLEFGLTSGFIIGPSFITCVLNFRWYLLDYQSQQILVKNYGSENVKQTSTALWIARFVLTLMMMGPVVRFVY